MSQITVSQLFFLKYDYCARFAYRSFSICCARIFCLWCKGGFSLYPTNACIFALGFDDEAGCFLLVGAPRIKTHADRSMTTGVDSMNNSIQIFGSDAFGEIRTMVDEHNEPLFCLKDVCRALELDSRQVTRRLDRGVVSKHHLRIKQRNVYSVKGRTKGIVNCYTLQPKPGC